jgi:hypothetical protein
MMFTLLISGASVALSVAAMIVSHRTNRITAELERRRRG